MPAFAERGVTVNRLRIRCGLDPMTARLRASWLLDESALQPVGLPPSTILCIRRLRDPRPGLVPLDGTRLPPRAWRDLVAASVSALARTAERPARGDVTGEADAVMFADRAELLASLAADWCAGRLASRWWARELLKDVGDGRSLLRAWLETPVYIAASLDNLAERGAAVAFVERLSAADSRALLEAVVVQHGLRSLAPAIEPLVRGDRRSPVAADDRTGGAATSHRHTMPGVASAACPPWRDRVPESVPTLSVDQQCLLGIALMTRRAPAILRSARFADEVQQWTRDIADGAATDAATGLSPTPSRDLPAADRHERSVRAQDDLPPTHDAPTDRGVPAPPLASRARRRDLDVDTNESTSPPMRSTSVERNAPIERDRPTVDATRTGAPHHDRGATAHVDGPIDERLTEGDSAPLASTIARSKAPAIDHAGETPDSTAIEPERRAIAHICPTSVATQLGGVFYLLNVTIALGLYGDFTTPLQLGIDLPIWDFLTLAARRLAPPRFRDDAIWALLADLAGRDPNDTLGTAMNATDRPARWLRWIVPCVGARLARTLGAVDRRRAGALLCVHRATVLTSATHIDVMFPLADLPIAIRLGGLDRNPGWIPAAGRVIAFHYD